VNNCITPKLHNTSRLSLYK